MLKKALFVVTIILLITNISHAQIPQLINYQGFLTDENNQPISDTHDIQFRIYDSPTGGAALWTETQTVSVSDGLFTVLLGSVSPIPATVFDGNTKYLSLQVNDDTEMTPRKQLVSVGYAFRSMDADKLDGQDASSFAPATHNHHSSYYQQSELNSNDGAVNQSGDPVSWYKIKNMPAGFADGTDDGGDGGDNLGNHTATQNINLNGHWLSGDGSNVGVFVTNTGFVGIGNSNPTHQLEVMGEIYSTGDVWTNDDLIANGQVASGGNITANGNIHSYDFISARYIVAEGPSSSGIGIGDIAADHDLLADDNVRAGNNVYAGNDLNAANNAWISGEIFNAGMKGYASANYDVRYNAGTDVIYYQTSSSSTKEDIQNLDDNFDIILEIQPKSYNDKQLGEKEIGYIAEEFDQLGLHNLVTYEDGKPMAIKYDLISLYLVEVLKKQQEKIEILENELKSLRQH